MKRPTYEEAGRFVMITVIVLLIELVARWILFDGPRESLTGSDVVIAIGVAVAVMGGWLTASGRGE